ncbi:treponemal membrane protein B isoform X1 [Drosophila ficusphila]|uniref:treponemal membrane protein B isoform X1 n=1 Tax=Drosophila ficusphila TaxID=30025 RepID=UPI0007E699C4|nr:treponemal membrane protein B isoform X1 [Drosophila ficusphila]XP_017052866.1 treponemal membrane protein B isoform X1 [Drosophila ficusphila]
MRLAPSPILVHLLLYYLLLIPTVFSINYQSSSNCQQSQPRQQSLDQSDNQMGKMGMRLGNSKQTATNIAQKAAQEAKQASDTQAPAALAAARQVKQQLAEKAIAAAKAAEAALAGKQQLLEQLQDEVHEAEIIVQEESNSLVSSQTHLKAAVATAKQAQSLLQSLQNLVKIAKEAVLSAEASASGAQSELHEKSQLVESARQRAEMLAQQMHSAKQDYANTKKAAYRAICAASEARQKAGRDRRTTVVASGQQQEKERQRQVQKQEQTYKGQPEEWEYNELEYSPRRLSGTRNYLKR